MLIQLIGVRDVLLMLSETKVVVVHAGHLL